MTTLRIFVSSPGDVAAERELARRVVDRLQGEFAGRVVLEPVLWEHEPLVATHTFQTQIVRPSETDVTVCILWSRLGTRLPKEFTRPDGRRYASGTEFEFEDAVEGYRTQGRPDLLVYRKTTDPVVSLSDPDELLRKLEQKRALDAFIQHWFIDEEEGTLRGAFHSFDRPEQFEALLETHLRKVVERRLPTRSIRPEPVGARWTKGSPFRGLQAFDVEHADVFFGRTAAIGEVLDALKLQHEAGRAFVLVVGQSGGGKSSLARAGVLPLLTRPGVVEGVGLWRRAILRPGDAEGDLLDGLTAALLSDTALPELAEAVGGAASLAPLLRDSPSALPALLRSALAVVEARAGAGARAGLALLVDQLEEIFTQADDDERQRFARALDVLARSGVVWIVGTLRADVYPRLAEVPILLELKEGMGQHDLRAPTPAELGQIVRHPVAAAGLRLEEDPATGQRLEDVLRDAAARTPNPLPLLEFTLEELYQQRTPEGVLTLSAYDAIGGMEGSLARRAEEAFQGCSAEARGAFHRVMRQLVVIADPEDAGTVGARRAPRERVASDSASAALVDALVEARLLVSDLGRDGTPVVGIAHEALLRHWPRLTEWLEDDRDLLKARARLAQAARRWMEEGRSPDFVLPPGKPLEEARDVQARGSGLSALEQEFLEVSLFRARRFVRLRRAAFAALTLLTLTAGGLAWSAHTARVRASEEALSATRTHQFTIGLLARSGSPLYTGGAEWSVKELLDHGTRLLLDEDELSDVPLTRARALLEWSRPYEIRQEYATALRLTRRALAVQEEQAGVPDSVRARTWLTLGEDLLELDSLDTARPYLEQAASALAGSALGARARASLGALRLAAGDAAAAAPLLEEALEEVGAADTVLRIATLTTLGRVRDLEQRRDDAEAVYREALALADGLEGGRRPDAYASVAQYLASVLSATGREGEADSVLAEAERRQVGIFGPEHGDVAVTVKLRGALARERGDLIAADSLLARALAIERAAFGARHSHPAITTLELAQLRMRQGRFEDAAALADEGRSVLAEGLGPHHPRVLTAWMVLANVYRVAGRPADALAAYDSSLVVETAADVGGDGGGYGARLAARGTLRAEMGDRVGAEADLGRALEVARAAGDTAQMLTWLDSLEEAFYALGDFALALERAEEALALRREWLPPGDPAIASTLGEVAFYTAARGDTARALMLVREGWDLLDALERPGTDAFEAHRALLNPLAVLEEWSMVAERAGVLRALLEQAAPPRPEELADVLLYEAGVRADLGQGAEAVRLARRGVALLEQNYGSGHPRTERARGLLRQIGG
ncbi:MAG: tetratricopeptide repeat protein [Gemmatimonadota bacterium]|nr:tetratricopeptide repeat protein [Gemmatimonadota bacterium]